MRHKSFFITLLVISASLILGLLWISGCSPTGLGDAKNRTDTLIVSTPTLEPSLETQVYPSVTQIPSDYIYDVWPRLGDVISITLYNQGRYVKGCVLSQG